MNAAANPWQASSPCTPRCVTHRLPPVPTMESVRRTVALTKVLTGTFPDDHATHDHDTGSRQGAGEHNGTGEHNQLGRHRDAASPDVQLRAAAVLEALGITLTVAGPDRTHDGAGRKRGGVGTLVVANHVSWLDIPVLLTLGPVTFLSKREVARWPFVGRQARRMGTLMLDRWSLSGLPASVDAVAERLRAGENVIAFPEATTWCSAPGGPFRRAVFQAAIDAGAPVLPITLSYRQRGEPSTIAAFVGDDSLAPSLIRVLRARELTVHARVHHHLEPAGERRVLAARAQHAVQGGSGLPAASPADPAAGTSADVDSGAARV